MKKIILFVTLLTGSFSVAFAQDNDGEAGNRNQKIQALYVAYITQQLNLSELEAQKFWPLHKEFDSELKGVDIEMPELERQQTLLNIKKKYQDRFVKILGPSRADNFFRLDTEFRKKLVDSIRQRRQQNNLKQRPLQRN